MKNNNNVNSLAGGLFALEISLIFGLIVSTDVSTTII